MRTAFFSFILLALLATPMVAHADPLCSDGSVAPGGNICNCASAASIGGSNFTPGTGSGLSGNTYSGITFNGIGGALASCLNVGGAISDAAKSLFSSTNKKTSTSSNTNTSQTVPTGDKPTQTATEKSQAELEKTTKREQCLNGAADAVAKTALSKLSDKTLNWVKTGFGGNPFYVRNIDSYLKTIKNEKLDSYLNTYVGNSNPIFGNALKSVLKQQATGYSDGLLNKAMNTPEGKAYQDFQSDFTKGGWNAFLNPQNNPVGAYFNATDELNSIIDTAQQNVKDELQQGGGFLSMKKCAEYETAVTSTATASTTYGVPTAGGSCSVIISTNYASCCTSVGGAATNQAQCAAYTGGYQTGTQAASPTKAPKCLRYETVTPGSLISAQVSSITNSTVRQLENTNKINQVLGTFFDQLMNRLLTDGITGSGRGRAASTVPGGIGSNVVLGTNGQTLASATACQTPLGYDATTGGFNQEFDISRPQQLRAVILTQKNFLTRSQDAQHVMKSLVPRLGALDYCIPGPNPTWNNNLNENTQTFLEGLQPVTKTVDGQIDYIHHILDPGQTLGGNDTSDFEELAGYALVRWSLFDKVDFGLKKISDRRYATNGITGSDFMGYYFNDILTLLKSKYNDLYSETAITNAFLATATSPADAALITGDIKDSIKETGNLVGYAQGVAAYNEQYNTNIQTTQDALTELIAIDQEVERIVARAKADYIDAQAAAGTPVKLSCIDNAYQIGPIPAGLSHLEDITATPDPFIKTSEDSSVYFYSHL